MPALRDSTIPWIVPFASRLDPPPQSNLHRYQQLGGSRMRSFCRPEKISDGRTSRPFADRAHVRVEIPAGVPHVSTPIPPTAFRQDSNRHKRHAVPDLVAIRQLGSPSPKSPRNLRGRHTHNPPELPIRQKKRPLQSFLKVFPMGATLDYPHAR